MKTRSLPLLALFLVALPLAAEVTLPAIFSDHAVLQRDKPLPVWGKAAPGERVEVPTGVAGYPREIAPVPPRSYAEKAYNVVHWKEQPKGGHFAAFEQPEIFLEDLREFLRNWG